MMNRYIKLVIPVLALMFACKEKVEVELPATDTRVVVESEITTETDSSFVKLSLTQSYYNTSPYPFITNATVVVNNDTFYHTSKGYYRPKSGYAGKADSLYKLRIVHDGKTYTSKSTLHAMFTIDSVMQVFKPKAGFLDEGYAVKYVGTDNRQPVKYTYFRYGKVDLTGQDSLFNALILFDNGTSQAGNFEFEVPYFRRLKVGETTFLIFRSLDKNIFDFINAFADQNSGAPGPFQVPPANLPSNIEGGALGYFACYDVKRFRITIK